jgi:hypothetical protein
VANLIFLVFIAALPGIGNRLQFPSDQVATRGPGASEAAAPAPRCAENNALTSIVKDL